MYNKKFLLRVGSSNEWIDMLTFGPYNVRYSVFCHDLDETFWIYHHLMSSFSIGRFLLTWNISSKHAAFYTKRWFAFVLPNDRIGAIIERLSRDCICLDHEFSWKFFEIKLKSLQTLYKRFTKMLFDEVWRKIVDWIIFKNCSANSVCAVGMFWASPWCKFMRIWRVLCCML